LWPRQRGPPQIRGVNRLDTLQPGKVWEGARSDVKPPPRIEYNPQSCRRFQLVQVPAVNIDCAFKVTERRGSYIAGEMSQNRGAAAWRVEGQFDGVTLSLETQQMIRGERRFFAYKGQVVGGLGFLQMQGIKVDGNPTEGSIVLELRR
jgi:hypothetical protein